MKYQLTATKTTCERSHFTSCLALWPCTFCSDHFRQSLQAKKHYSTDILCWQNRGAGNDE